ncbi:MAG: peptide chain release factor 1 [Alphaproteobacteria bacterium]|nr:MAG: peptide chain release factor 1 [Alphaproteobacteria bacterium]|tara:strand:- start:106 stop:1182 length:1077 start_codon:yes stop_codon:yes gene_type:complete
MINLEDNIKKFFKRKLEIEETLSTSNLDPKEYATLSKELSDVTQVTDLSSLINSKKNELEDLYILLKDKESDADLQDMAREESKMLENELNSLNKKLELAILPKDKDDQRNVILEVRAGTGGDEAGIFAANLFNMYQKFSMNNNWKFEILSVSDTGVGGYKEAHANIVGGGAFGKLKFESGVHRVQRVPVTETNGRVHTSAATVAVLPEAEDVEINLNEKDLRIDVYRSSGPGGQSVNTTDSAVRITHIPSGIVVSQQDEKSQHKNKAKAMKILLARLYDQERQIQNSKIASTRKNQVGTGDRSERIRTYNYPQGRVTDHRINLTLHKIEKIIEGEGLDEIIDNLILKDRMEKLEENG